MAISPLQLARVPTAYAAGITAGQLQTTQQELLVVEEQLSTGQLYTQPSDNLINTSTSMQLQRTLAQRQVYAGNLSSAKSQLGQIDNTLGSVTNLLQQAQTIASADVNTSTTSAQRQADAQIIQSIYEQVFSLANTQYNGQYLFGGDKNSAPPFVQSRGGVQFVGTSDVPQNSVDANTTAPLSVAAQSVFGATSGAVQGTADLTPNLTANTRLADLRGVGGNGVSLGAIVISNGTTSKLVDLSKADTIGDVTSAINAAGVGGITAAISGQGLTLSGGPTDNISVTDVAGDSTATDLGIAQPVAAGAGTPLVGASAQANVTVLTPLSALKGGVGIDSHGLTISVGGKVANIALGSASTVGDLINAINGADLGASASINSAGTGLNIVNTVQGLTMSITENGGTTAADLGVKSYSATTPLSDLNGGKGIGLASGGLADFQIIETDGTKLNVSLAGATTVQDVLNKINAAAGGVGLTASFSASANGIVLTDTAGGTGTLSITGQNGSTAVADLGLSAPAVGNTISGSDVNPVSAGGIFTDLANLRDALTAGDPAKITLAAQGLRQDSQAVVQTRGAAGAQVQEMQARQDQITTENAATQSLMSQLSDTDFTTAITRFQTLQTSLQATLEASAKTLNESLLNFLG